MGKIADYFGAEKYVGTRLLLLAFGGALVIIPLAFAFSNGLLSPRALASVMIGYAACVAIAVFAILRNAQVRFQVSSGSVGITDDVTHRKFRNRIRRLQLGVAFFALVFVFALWETRHDPWPPRLIGAIVNLLIEIGMIQSIKKMQRQLEDEASEKGL